jgi:hypothetical protein
MRTDYLFLSLAAIAIAARPAAAQDQRLDRLTPETRALVVPAIDSARAAGLPVEPLVERALEGTSKGASADLIARVVRRVAGDLARARDALGKDAPPEALIAGADALRAGAAPGVLLRDALGTRRVAVPLAVTADLIARGVPADAAATLTLARARSTTDADLLALERNVERDIALGAEPLAATAGQFSGNPATEFTGAPGTPKPPSPKPRKP